MGKCPKGRLGPITLLHTNQRLRGMVVAIAITAPMLYVASYGPLTTLFVREHDATILDENTGRLILVVATSYPTLWFDVYAPLIWVEEQEWGRPLAWYRELFPIYFDPELTHSEWGDIVRERSKDAK